METLIFNIDSRHRDVSKYPSQTDFTIDLNENIKNVAFIKLSSVEYGNTSHVFNSTKKNNSFVIDDSTITVPDGNYNSDEIITKINELIIDAGILTIEFSLDSNSGKTTITVTDDHIFDFSPGTFLPVFLAKNTAKKGPPKTPHL